MRVLLLCALVSSLTAQTYSQQDAKMLLLEVRKKQMLTLDRLPRYMCTETVDRSMFEPQVKVARRSCDDLTSLRKRKDWIIRQYESDRLRLDVAISGNTEMYTWAGQDRFQNQRLSKLVLGGVTATGEFKAFLDSIFGTSEAHFAYTGDLSVGGRSLVEFSFSVPLEQSSYRISKQLQSAVVAYDGTFLVDPKTFDLVRLTVHAFQLPEELGCDITTTLDYRSLRLNNSEFLLPSAVHLHVVEADGAEAENRTVFTGCHEFLGESTLRFDDDARTQPVTNQQGSSTILPLPAGQQFRFALTRAIDPATAAAGDQVKATLTSPIKDKRGHVLVPKGAAVTGRIVQIMWRYGSQSESLTLALKLETVEADGVPRAFDTRMESTIKTHTNSIDFSAVRQTLGSFDQMLAQADPAIGFLEFPNVTRDYVIDRGLEIQAMTADPR
jgi:hypothetical protein